MRISVVVPCFNEVDNVDKLHDELLPVLVRLAEHGWDPAASHPHAVEVVFVDDGSRDDTTARLRSCFAPDCATPVTYKFCRHETNCGLGAAIRTGFAQAGGDVIATVDCDGTYAFSEIPAILARLTPDVDIVTASPYHPDGHVVGVPADRLLLSRSSSLLYRILVEWHVYTYTALFRVYRAEVIRCVQFKSNGFLAGTELLVKAMLAGYRVAEYPAVLHKRMYGVSKAKIAQTIRAHLRFQGRILTYRTKQLFGIQPQELA